MELVVLGSSSKGNCYILDNGNEALILEAGVALKAVKEALRFNVRKVSGCCVTHQHNDHAGYISKYAGLFHTLALADVWRAKEYRGSHAVSVNVGQSYKLGNYVVMPFDVEHDVPCVGYLIHHPSMGLMMFATDTCSLDYTVPGLNHVLVECNYSVDALRKAVEENRTDVSQVARLAKSHLEFASTKAFLSRNDLSKVTEIVLIHLSGNNADEGRFVSEIQAMTGKPTYAAHAGLRLDLIKP
ncbi:MAG: MBL fold metallo-hydrolase [Bacteroidaceae bacterium]|nr:MBL fold metallo-hydrolase [Bacteroidaceae bacterium]